MEIDNHKCLIDTGSTKSFINPKIVESNKNNYEICEEKFTLYTAHGISNVTHYVNYYFNNVQVKFYLFNFHNQFDMLLGLDDLKLLNANYAINQNKITLLNNYTFKLKYFNKPRVRFQPGEIKNVKYTTELNNVDLLIENNENLNPNIFIPDCIVKVRDHRFEIPMKNTSQEMIEINNVDQLNYSKNFKIAKKKIDFGKVRTDHLLPYEKEPLSKLMIKYSNIFYNEDEKLTFTNKIKHDIKTTDEIPVHVKTYRYPHCYKKKIESQIENLLKNGIIKES